MRRKPSLSSYRKNMHSQNGEDGIIEELLRRLKIEDGWCCELGAWDGKHLSNSFHLIEQGWRGVMIEGDHERYQKLLATAVGADGRIIPIEALVTAEGSQSLDRLLAATPIPHHFELLSIDVDGCDLHLWRGLRDYCPKIVAIEIDSSYPPGVLKVDSAEAPGSSFTAMLQVGLERGYSLVAHTGNLIFVRNDLLPQLNLPARELENPEQLFLYKWVSPGSISLRVAKIRDRVRFRLA